MAYNTTAGNRTADRDLNRQGSALSGGSHLPGDLDELENLDDWEIADGQKDPRGMDIYNRDGEKIGEIDNLLASPSMGRAYFAIIKTGNLFHRRRFAVPMEYLHFDRDRDRMIVGCSSDLFQSAPDYNPDARAFDSYRDYWNQCGTAGTATRAAWAEEQTRTAEARPAGTTDTAGEIRVPVTEETAEIHRTQRQAGFLTIKKRVETEHKQVTVPVTRTHVTVERHNLSPEEAARYDADQAQVMDDGETMRIPIVEEDVEVRKVPRVTEEVVVKSETDTRQEQRDVELRKEEVDVDKEGDVRQVGGNRPARR